MQQVVKKSESPLSKLQRFVTDTRKPAYVAWRRKHGLKGIPYKWRRALKEQPVPKFQHRKVLLGEAIEKYVNLVIAWQSEPARIRIERNRLLVFRDFCGRQTPLSTIDQKTVLKYLAALKREGKTVNTIHSNICSARAFLACCSERWQLIRPIPRLNVPVHVTQKRRHLSFKEEQKFLSACSAPLRSLLVFMIETGILYSQARDLKWSNVDLGRGKNGWVTPPERYGKTFNALPLSNRACALLKRLKESAPPQNEYVFLSRATRNARDSEGILVAERGVLKHYLNAHADFKRALAKSRLQDVNLKAFHYSFAMRLIEAGVPLFKVSYLLNRTTAESVRRHGSVSSRDLEDALRVFDKFTMRERSKINMQMNVN